MPGTHPGTRTHKSSGRGSQRRSIPHLGEGKAWRRASPWAPGTGRGGGRLGALGNWELPQRGEKEREKEVGAGKFSAAPRPGAPHRRRGPSPAAGRPTPAAHGPARRSPPARPSPAPAPRRALPPMPPALPPLPRPPPCCRGDEEAPPPAALRPGPASPQCGSIPPRPGPPLPRPWRQAGGAPAARPCPPRLRERRPMAARLPLPSELPVLRPPPPPLGVSAPRGLKMVPPLSPAGRAAGRGIAARGEASPRNTNGDNPAGAALPVSAARSPSNASATPG